MLYEWRLLAITGNGENSKLNKSHKGGKMKKNLFVQVTIPSLLFIVLSGALQAPAAPAGQDLEVGLRTDQRWLEGPQRIEIEFVMANTSKEPVQVLRWQTPIDGIEHDLFRVMRNGSPVTYTGILAKRPEPIAEDYIVIKPGEKISVAFDPSVAYDMTVRGEYTIQYHAVLDRVRRTKAGVERFAVDVRSNSVLLWSEGLTDTPAFKAKPQPLFTEGTIAYESCATDQQATLQTAHSNATMISGLAVDHLAANPSGSSLYTTWFGAYTSTRFNIVSNNYDAIYDAFQNAPVTYNCKCRRRVFAYVYPSQPYRIYLCRVFWQVSPLGRDSQAGTLVHEMSHFYVVASTDDYVYGASGAMDLAITNPDQAIDNADNHEYFAEDQY
jgi:peptidyl-Lys metalloendopeptidase